MSSQVLLDYIETPRLADENALEAADLVVWGFVRPVRFQVSGIDVLESPRGGPTTMIPLLMVAYDLPRALSRAMQTGEGVTDLAGVIRGGLAFKSMDDGCIVVTNLATSRNAQASVTMLVDEATRFAERIRDDLLRAHAELRFDADWGWWFRGESRPTRSSGPTPNDMSR